MTPFIVFIKHRDEPDMYLYALLTDDERLANQGAFDTFRTDYGPFDDDADWHLVSIPLSFTPRPVWVTRVDRL